jgi:hypothetical protein
MNLQDHDAISRFPELRRHFLALQANTRIAPENKDLLARYILYAAHHNIPAFASFPRKSPRHIARFLSAIVNDFAVEMATPMSRAQILQKLNAFCAHTQNTLEPSHKYTPPTIRTQLYAAIRYVPGITRTTKHRGRKLFAFTDRPALLKHLQRYNDYHPDASLRNSPLEICPK